MKSCELVAEGSSTLTTCGIMYRKYAHTGITGSYIFAGLFGHGGYGEYDLWGGYGGCGGFGVNNKRDYLDNQDCLDGYGNRNGYAGINNGNCYGQFEWLIRIFGYVGYGFGYGQSKLLVRIVGYVSIGYYN